CSPAGTPARRSPPRSAQTARARGSARAHRRARGRSPAPACGPTRPAGAAPPTWRRRRAHGARASRRSPRPARGIASLRGLARTTPWAVAHAARPRASVIVALALRREAVVLGLLEERADRHAEQAGGAGLVAAGRLDRLADPGDLELAELVGERAK